MLFRSVIAGAVQVGVVRFADSEEVGCWITRRQLDDVSYQSGGTEAKHMNPYENTGQNFNEHHG